ncbi:MAG: hypothetical protein CMJ46_12685 [Planctomyces sp.]|nr:hypothetical protein [Planctomyces sp.]
MIALGTGSDYWQAKMKPPRFSAPTDAVSVDVFGNDAGGTDALSAACLGFLSRKTGYPVTVFDFDASLEEAYGVDGYMLVEMLIEVSKRFDLSPLTGLIRDLDLGASCTLRRLLNFIHRNLDSEKVYQDLDLRRRAESSLPADFPIPVVELTGSPYEIGFQHGRNQAAQTKQVTRAVARVLGPRILDIPELNEAICDPTLYFGESEIEEMQGLADGLGISFPAVLGHNLGLYPEYIPGCSQFVVSEDVNGTSGMLHCVNEDSPITMIIGSAMRRVLQLRNPADGYRSLLYSIAGQVGGLNGINECGLTVTTTILLDRPRRPETAKGRIHPAIVKNILENADCIESALAVFHSLDRNGAWSLCLSEANTGRICYLEYDGHDIFVRNNLKRLVSTNHAILFPPFGNKVMHSEYRLQRLEQILDWENEGEIDLELAKSSLRDRFDLQRGRVPAHPTKNSVRRNDNQGSLVFAPQEGRLFITPGPMQPEREDHYYELDLNGLLSQPVAAAEIEEAVA